MDKDALHLLYLIPLGLFFFYLLAVLGIEDIWQFCRQRRFKKFLEREGY